MQLPIVPVKYCSHLKGKKPSQITDDMLIKVSGGGKMEKCAGAAWEAMVTAAKTDGIILKPTSSGDQFRSIAQQKAGFLIRYSEHEIVGASTRTYDGKKWWLKPHNAPLAAPNDDAKTCSKHMLGLAVDVANANGKILNWLVANEQKFGFSHEVVPEEPWHIRYTAGDDIPEAVKQ